MKIVFNENVMSISFSGYILTIFFLHFTEMQFIYNLRMKIRITWKYILKDKEMFLAYCIFQGKIPFFPPKFCRWFQSGQKEKCTKIDFKIVNFTVFNFPLKILLPVSKKGNKCMFSLYIYSLCHYMTNKRKKFCLLSH